MQTFKVKLWERLESPPQEPHRGTEDPGFRAPGRIVLVFREGSGWVTGQDGSREAVEARTVVIYETGDWIEYGDDGSGDAFEAELYGASALSGERDARGMNPAGHTAPLRAAGPAYKAMRIGRTADNDLILAADLAVSRHHAELREVAAGSYEIVDLGSHGGTFVNGKRVSRATLTEHDIVSIGQSAFRLAEGELRQLVNDSEAS